MLKQADKDPPRINNVVKFVLHVLYAGDSYDIYATLGIR